VTGNGSFGIFMQDQHNVVMSASNTMALLGGKMIINPATGSGAGMVSTPVTALDVRGSIMVGNGAETCGATYAGAIRYLVGTGMQYCNGTAWTNLASTGAVPLNSITAAAAANTPIDNASYAQEWDWSTLATGTAALTLSDTNAAGGTGTVLDVNNASTGAGFGVNSTMSGAGNTGYAIYGANTSTTGANYGVYGVVASSANNASAVWGLNNGGTGAGAGVQGNANSTGAAYGVYGVETGAGNTGYGVYGSNTGGGSGINWGGYFETGSTGAAYGVEGKESGAGNTGYGVYGANTSTTGANHGVYGVVASSDNNAAGVWGLDNSATGAGVGVQGNANSAGAASGVYGVETGPSNTGYGVYGTNTGTTNTGYGGYFTNTGGGTALGVNGALRILGTTGYVGFVAQSSAGSTTYTLPAADGSNGYQLTTNGTGGLTWAAASTAGAPANAATELFGGIENTAVAATRFYPLTPAAVTAQTAVGMAAQPVGIVGTFKNFCVTIGSTANSGTSIPLTLYRGAAGVTPTATAITLTIPAVTAAGVTTCDNTHTITTAVNDTVAVGTGAAVGPGTISGWSIEFDVTGGGGGIAALSGITAAVAANTIANGNWPQTWNWAQTTAAQTGMAFGETSAASGGAGNQYLASFTTLAGSTATPVKIVNSLTGSQALPALSILPTWNTSGVVDAALLINVTNTASGAASKLIDAQVGGGSLFTVQAPGAASASAEFGGTAAVTLPKGTTAAEPTSPVVGMIRYNTDTNAFEGYQGSTPAWSSLGSGGGGTPAGATTQVQFNSGGVFGANANFVWDNTNGILTVTGAATNDSHSLVVKRNSGSGIEALSAGPNPGDDGFFEGWRSRGTIASPTAVGVDDSIAALGGDGYDGSAYQLAAYVDIVADGAPSAGLVPGRITFVTQPAAGGSLLERMRISNGGNIGINTTTPGELLFVSGGNLVATGTFGSSPAIAESGAGTRMMWYPQKAAFRTGGVSGTQWDDANIGNYSTATGLSTTASGSESTAMGYTTTAAGTGSTALGQYVMAGDAANTNGNYSMAIGLTNTSTATRAKMTGAGSLGIFMGDQHNVAMSASNTMALLGGNMIINPVSGTGAAMVSTPDTTLDVRGEVKVGNTSLVCSATTAGALRYNNGTSTFEGCNGGSWGTLAAPTPACNYALTDGPTIAVNWANCNVQYVTLGGNRTFTFAGGQPGARYILIIKQDGTGSRTVTWPSTAVMRWPGGVSAVLTTTATKTDYIGIIYNNVDSRYDVVSISKKF
jgi:hypothetical protein